MPRYVFFDTAFHRDDLNIVLTIIVAWNGQQLIPFGYALVFLNDMLGYIQQLDIRLDTRF